MTSAEIKERIEKKQATLKKKAGTIEKKTGWIAKKEAELAKINDEHERRWVEFDIRNLKEDIERIKKEIAKGEKQIAEWETKMQAVAEKEKEWEDVPECLKEFENELIARWNEWDKQALEDLKRLENERHDAYDADNREKVHELSYQIQNHPGRHLRFETAETIERENRNHARRLVQNFIERVKKITGEITDWTGLWVEQGNTFEGAVITGTVIGAEGVAEVETILAGGYNIQRLHVRTLVHKR